MDGRSVRKSSSMQSFSQWCVTQIVPVSIRSAFEIPGLEPVLAELLRTRPPRRSLCFDNALTMARFLPSVRYVLGRASRVPGDHAWNELNGLHFDLTAEFAYQGRLDLGRYQAIISLSYQEAIEVVEFRKAPSLPDVWLKRLNDSAGHLRRA